MTTQSWSTRVRHDSDATFREWGSEFNSMLAAIGLVQTSDTGQINWASATRPGTGSFAGYEVWRFDDTLQGTAPIFLKFEYGTWGGNATAPRIRIGVGIATDGSGNVTTIGGGAAGMRDINNQQAQTSDNARTSYFCHTEGFLGLAWKLGTGGNTVGTFLLCRTVDSDGDPTATGALARWGIGQTGAVTSSQAMRFAATAELYAEQTSLVNAALCLNPQVRSVSTIGSDIQAFIAWTITPAVAPLVGICGVISSEVPTGNTFDVALVGATQRTYIALESRNGPMGAIDSSSTGGLKPAMLWE